VTEASAVRRFGQGRAGSHLSDGGLRGFSSGLAPQHISHHLRPGSCLQRTRCVATNRKPSPATEAGTGDPISRGAAPQGAGQSVSSARARQL